MKQLRKIVILALLTLMLTACNNTNGSNDKDMLSIGVIQFTSHSALDATYEGFLAELETLGLIEGEDFILDYNNAQGDTATAETIASKLVNANHDLIYAIATPAAQAVANKTSDIPIIVNAVTDPESAGLVDSNDVPNTNVSGVSDLTPVKRQIELLHEVAPDVKKVAIVYANSETNSRYQADIAKKEIENLNLEWHDASVSDSNQLQQMVESLVGKVDAIYVPTDNLVAESYPIVTNLAFNHKIVTVSGERGMVEAGGLITDGISYINLGHKAGEMAYKVLVDKIEISTLPITYLQEEDLELYINETTEEQLGLSISDSIRQQATIIK